ncbi:hypothetical protein [Paenibacillus sp. FSL M8-0142]|uniref:hypothetical protein n=1 Tax=Paenibacillus sp. FSL M8-0142 TaxID=2954525 RepID=UPI003159B5E1
MTVVINYLSDTNSVIATDNRVSIGRGGEYGFEDGVTKLVNVPHYAMGWTAGSGYGEFLDNFKNELVQTEMSFNEILTMYNDVRERAIVDSLLLLNDDISRKVSSSF